MDKKDFMQKFHMSESQFCGERPIDGPFDIGELESVPEGFNPLVYDSLVMRCVKTLPPNFRPTVYGDLNLYSLTSLPDGFSPKITGRLHLDNVTELPEDFTITVGGLLLYKLEKIPKGFAPIISGNLHVGAKNITKDFMPIVGGDINFTGNTTLHENFNLHIGGCVNFKTIESIPLGFTPTIGGHLFMKKTGKIPFDFNPVVFGSITFYDPTDTTANYNSMNCERVYIKGADSLPEGFIETSIWGDKRSGTKILRGKVSEVIFWQNRKYAKFNFGFLEITEERQVQINDELIDSFLVRKINTDKNFFVVNLKEKFAYGDSLFLAFEHAMSIIDYDTALAGFNNAKTVLSNANENLTNIVNKCNADTLIKLVGVQKF